MRLIDADELVKTLSEEAVHLLKQEFCDYSTAEARGIVIAIDSVKKAPTIEPVKRGHWVLTNDYYTGAYGTLHYYKCSVCQKDTLEDEFGIGDYCSWCGAELEYVKNE